MSIERTRLNGLQDRRLELGRDKTTPTKDSDITPRARLFMGLVENAVYATMALEGMSDGRATPDMLDEQVKKIRVARHDAVVSGFSLMTFDLRVKMKIEEMREKEKEEQDDEDLAHTVREALLFRSEAI